jgi:dipeptidyl aminopeptidase/acylaminoacyl peptidase
MIRTAGALAASILGLVVLEAADVRAADTGAAAPAPAAATPAATASASLVDTLGRLPTLEHVSISPGGTRLAYVSTNGDQRALAIWSIAEKKRTWTAGLGEIKLRRIVWVDEDHLLLTHSVTAYIDGLAAGRREWVGGITCDLAQSKCAPLQFGRRNDSQMFGNRSDAETLNVLAGGPWVRTVDGRATLFVGGFYVPGNITQLALFSVDPASGLATMVNRGSREAQDWLLDENGRIVAETDYDARTHTYSVAVRASDGRVSPVAGLDAPQLLGLAADGRGVLVRNQGADGELHDLLVSLADRSVAPFEHAVRDGMPLLDRITGRVVGFESELSPSYAFVDTALQRRWDSTAAALKGSRTRLVSHSDDFGRLVLLTDRADDGLVFRMLDWTTKRAEVIGDRYRGMETYPERRAYAYRAQDGLEIPGFLTLPQGREPKSLPLVVLPHGGPDEVDADDFDWWAEALASRGYAVLQPNFRGSTVSEAHRVAGDGQVGRRMQTDLSDGVAALVAAGTADRARVCIVGASYGGYAALAGVALQPDVYRCAVAVAGISDPQRFVRWLEYEHSAAGDHRPTEHWLRLTGMKDPSDPKFAEISPIAHAGAVRAPVLLIHGKDDTVVPIEQSESFAAALKSRGKPVEVVMLKREDHWLSRSETRLQMLQATVDFLERNNPPR